MDNKLMVIMEVANGSKADQAGIQPGDILLKYCEWELSNYNRLTYDNCNMLYQVMQENMDREKALVIGRENEKETDLEFCAIDLESGMEGLRVQDEIYSVARTEFVREQYEKWKEEKGW